MKHYKGDKNGKEQKENITYTSAVTNNSYAALDPALIRPGRFDLKYTIGNPDKKTRMELVEMYTKGKTLEEELNAEKLADLFNGMSCSAIESVLNEAAVCMMVQKKEFINLACIMAARKKMNL